MTASKTREEFEAWYVVNAFDFERNPIGSRECGLQWAAYQAARRSTLEQAAQVCESARDLKEAARAQKAADEAISRNHHPDMLSRLRHCSSVSLFNCALEQAARAIRALGDEGMKP